MPVEDVFSITGRGTVATGRVERGTLKMSEEVEDKDGIFKMTVGDGSWRVIYTALLVSGNTVAQTETPEPIRKGKGYSPLACDAEEIKKNLSWKRLLIALLES